jgi:hypothetical protein
MLLFQPAANARQSATLTVSATVRPSCRFLVETTDARVACGRKDLRSLRASTTGGTRLAGITVDRPAIARAGGEIRFVIPVAVGLVAAREIASVRQSAPAPIIVTFDF